MKTHTSNFKEQIKLMGKEIDSRITFGGTVLGKDDLNAVTPSYQGTILKSVMKQLDIDSNVEIPIGTILRYEFGLKVNGEYEYINYGNYVVYSIEKQEDTNSYKIVCYDKLLYSMLEYVKLPIIYPTSIRDYIDAVSTALGLTFANKNDEFANYDKQIQADLYDGLGYTFRDVLDELAQVTASTICLNNNDELEIRYITETGDTIDEEFLKDVNVNFGEKFGAVNTIVLSRSGDSDSVYYPSTLPTNPYEIKISDNQIMNGNDRADFLPDIYNKLNGLEFYTNDFVSTGICYYDLCDRYSVKVGNNTYSCVMLNDEVLVTQGLEENIYTELPEQTETDYKHASKDDRMINQVYIIAKKNEAEILALVSTTEEIKKELTPVIEATGSNIYIENVTDKPLLELAVEGKSIQETRIGKNLFGLKDKTTTTSYGLTYSVTNNEIVINGTATASDRLVLVELYKPLVFNSSTNYKLSIVSSGSVSDNSWNIQLRTSNSNVVVRTLKELLESPYDIQNISQTVTHLGFYIGAKTVFTNFKIKLQVEKGNVATEYEEPGSSPSPDYPSKIESVGYENLFKLNDVAEFTSYGLTISVKDNLLSIKGTASSATGIVIGNLAKNINLKSGKNYVFSGIQTGQKTDALNVQLRSDDTSILAPYTADLPVKFNNISAVINKLRIYVPKGITFTDYTLKMQIVESKEEKEYIEFGKYGIEVKATNGIDTNKLLIILNEPLRSLPNEVKDIAYIKNNKLYVDRYVGSVVFNGSESWATDGTTANTRRYTLKLNDTKLNDSENSKMSNHFIYSYNYGLDEPHFYINPSGIIYIFSNITDLATFKTWLSTHNTEVQYELANPYTEEIGNIEILETVNGNNYITTTDKLQPIINIKYLTGGIFFDYVENYVSELKITDKEIMESVQTVSKSVDGLDSSIERVEEITTSNSQVINVISTNIDKTSGEVREVTTTTGFTFNADGMTINDGSGFKAQHRANGTYYKDGESIVGQYTKDGSKQKDLELFGTYSYGKESIDDTPMFVGQLYADENSEQGFGHFYNGEG